MSWNYRIILHDTDADPEKHWHGLHEVYYSEDGKLSWTEDAITFVCDLDEGPDGIIGSLELALKSLRDPRFSTVLKETELLAVYEVKNVSC